MLLYVFIYLLAIFSVACTASENMIVQKEKARAKVFEIIKLRYQHHTTYCVVLITECHKQLPLT